MYDEQIHLEAYALEWESRSRTAAPEMVRRCMALADAMGAEGFGLLLLSPQGEERRLSPLAEGGPSGLSGLTSSRAADQLARMAAELPGPLWWAAETGPRLCDEALDWARKLPVPVADEAGIAFPVSLECGRMGIFVFVGDDIELDIEALCETHSRCFALFAEAAGRRNQADAGTPQLSRRELECLRLTADGLTSDNIASALGLSVHTANRYLTNSTHKLNAVNRIHAVAKALRGGLID